MNEQNDSHLIYGAPETLGTEVSTLTEDTAFFLLSPLPNDSTTSTTSTTSKCSATPLSPSSIYALSSVSNGILQNFTCF